MPRKKEIYTFCGRCGAQGHRSNSHLCPKHPANAGQQTIDAFIASKAGETSSAPSPQKRMRVEVCVSHLFVLRFVLHLCCLFSKCVAFLASERRHHAQHRSTNMANSAAVRSGLRDHRAPTRRQSLAASRKRSFNSEFQPTDSMATTRDKARKRRTRSLTRE